VKRILLLSGSLTHGTRYLEWCDAELREFLAGCRTLTFVPYARPGGISLDEYTARNRARLEELGMELRSVHEDHDPAAAVREAEVLFIGGGNTFLLLRWLYQTGLLEPIRKQVAGGMPYVGSSAGSNVAGLTIGTTNDMPIVHPPSFDALGLVPFNLNPHYLDPDPESRHQGESRETRIREFHVQNPQPVVGLREGAALWVEGAEARLVGAAGARLFRRGDAPEEFAPGSRLDFLLH